MAVAVNDLILRTQIGKEDDKPVIAEVWLSGKPTARNLRTLRRALDLTIEAFDEDDAGGGSDEPATPDARK